MGSAGDLQITLGWAADGPTSSRSLTVLFAIQVVAVVRPMLRHMLGLARHPAVYRPWRVIQKTAVIVRRKVASTRGVDFKLCYSRPMPQPYPLGKSSMLLVRNW